MLKKVLISIFKINIFFSVLISLLIISFFSYFVYMAVFDFYMYKTCVDPKYKLTLDRFHFFLRNEFKKEWIKIKADKPLPETKTPLKTFYITVDPDDLEKLNEDLPRSGKEQYVNGYMKVSDISKIYKIKLRYRGDNIFHWLFQQKSLRIKIKNGLYNMEKSFNLINPPMFLQSVDIITYDIAKTIGLISPDYFPVRVFINGEYMGVYNFLSQVDESLLRKDKRMPGSIYYGDAAPTNEEGIYQLFFNEKFWQKKAARNAEQKFNREDIKYFINAINNFDDIKFYNFVRNMISNKYFYYIALDRYTGTNHHDFAHNHKIYFDPYIGKFEPIEWDTRFWIQKKFKDMSLYPLLLRIASNPVFDAEIDKILYSLLEEFPISKIENKYQKILTVVKGDIETDKFKDTALWLPKLFPSPSWYSVPFTYNEMLDWFQHNIGTLQKRMSFLYKVLNNTRIKTYIEDKYLYFEVNGNSPVLVTFPNNIKLSKVYKGKKYKALSKEILYPGRIRVKGAQQEFSRAMLGTDRVKITPLVYKFELEKSYDIKLLLNKIKCYNYITGNKVRLVYSTKPFVQNKNIIHPWMFIKYNIPKEIILNGTIPVTKTLEFDKNTTVIIKPGTKFIMYPGCSIYFYGKVNAVGTKDNPIKFTAKNPDRPWGIVALQGKGTTGSKFAYVEIENGSVDTHNLIHYTAPFNIHDTDWFEVRHCRIGKNFVGDDSMHIAYAKGIVEGCVFENARSDALDIDIGNVVVQDNIFYNAGNDALDLMTTTIKSYNNIFAKTGDKGISVGEWSNGEIKNCLFIDNYIGLEIKDKSRIASDNIIIINAKKWAIHLYNKNHRYDEGGFLNIKDFYLGGNDKIVHDKKSNISMKNRVILKKIDLKFLNQNYLYNKYRNFIKDNATY